MKRVKITQDYDVPITTPSLRTLRLGDQFDVEDEPYFKAHTDEGEFWLPQSVVEELSAAIEEETSATLGDVEDGRARQSGEVIETYRSDRYRGNPIQVSADFIKELALLESWAVELDLYIHVTSSFRQKDVPVTGAIVPPARRSNHYVGHAIDMNLIYRGNFFNSSKLADFHSLPGAIQNFIGKIRAHDYLRWGGDFMKADPVHIDDNLSRRYPNLWDEKFIRLAQARA